MKEKIIEEILQLLWTKKENGERPTLEELSKASEPHVEDSVIRKMVDDGYLIINGAGLIDFQENGLSIARQIVRCHRLAERLFNDILELGHKVYESTACTFEHILSPEVTEAICTLLGHPKECPHSKPIPPGDCCRRAEKEVERVIVPLSELKSGKDARVVYISSQHHNRMDRLTSLGVVPGIKIHVHQTYPSYVIQIEETQLALDREILQDVYVRPEKVSRPAILPGHGRPSKGRGPATSKRRRIGFGFRDGSG